MNRLCKLCKELVGEIQNGRLKIEKPEAALYGQALGSDG